MPKIQWSNLSTALRQHLFDRLEELKMRVAIAGMVIAMKWRGVTGGTAMAALLGVVVVFSSAVLGLFLRIKEAVSASNPFSLSLRKP